MVPPCSDRISRVPPYSNGRPFYDYGAVTRSGPASQPVRLYGLHGLVRVRSPLLAESLLMSFPPGTEMFQFPGFALCSLWIQPQSTCQAPCPLPAVRSVRHARTCVPRQRTSRTSGQTTDHLQVGCPIRRSRDQRVLSPPPGLSQSATSFIASCRQGIHQTPFSRLIRSGEGGSRRPKAGLSASPISSPAIPLGRETTGRSVFDLERLSLSVLPLASLAA